jgi:hypothetical protein
MTNIRHRIGFGFPSTIDIDGSDVPLNYNLTDQAGNDLLDQLDNAIQKEHE